MPAFPDFSYSSSSSFLRHFPCTLALLAQKRRVACLSKSMSCARHDQAPIQKHEQKTRHVKQSRDASYISSFCMKIWSFSHKAKYARLRTLPPSPFGTTEDMPRFLVGSRGSSFQPCNVPRRIKGLSFGRLSASFPPPLSKIIHRSRDIADFPCPPSAEISAIISYFYVLLKVHLQGTHRSYNAYPIPRLAFPHRHWIDKNNQVPR